MTLGFVFRLAENVFVRYGGQECPPYNDKPRGQQVAHPTIIRYLIFDDLLSL